jgi:hypothetical protein
MKALMPSIRIVPPEGTHMAVLVDAEEQNDVETPYGIKDRVRLIFEIDVVNAQTSKRMLVSRSFTASIHSKSALRAFVENLVGRKLNDDKIREAGGFHPSSLVGRSCQLVLVHEQNRDGQIYSNIRTVIPLPAGVEPLKVKDYARKAVA